MPPEDPREKRGRDGLWKVPPQPRRRAYLQTINPGGGSLLLDRGGLFLRCQSDNSKQKEIYNFQKVAALLADYGFNCIKLDDDWQGADFLAYHKDGTTTLKVQLKSRVGIHKKYQGKDLYLAFPTGGRWHLLPHDTLVQIAKETTNWLQTRSWLAEGEYNAGEPPQQMLSRLSQYYLDDK